MTPGQEYEGGLKELAAPIRQAFRAAISQGAGRLLGRSNLQPEDVTEEVAAPLIDLIEDLYDRERWLLPVLPFGLHLLLRRMDLDV